MKFAVRQLIKAFGHSRYADVLLNEVVIWSHILITERPILSIPVMGRGLEIQITEPITLPSPDIRAAPGYSQAAHPGERHALRHAVRFLEIIAEPLVVVLRGD